MGDALSPTPHEEQPAGRENHAWTVSLQHFGQFSLAVLALRDGPLQSSRSGRHGVKGVEAAGTWQDVSLMDWRCLLAAQVGTGETLNFPAWVVDGF